MSHALQQIVENAPLLLIGLRATLMLAAVTLAASPVIGVVLGTLAIAVLWMGLYPAPFTEIMHVSVGELLKHLAASKL